MFCKCAKNFECSSHSRAVLGHGPNWTKLDLWMIRNNNIGQFFFQSLKISRGAFAMISLRKKFFSVFEIFHTKLSERNILGIQNVLFLLFFNNYCLYFCCQMVIIFQKISSLLSFLSFYSSYFLAQINVLGHISVP